MQIEKLREKFENALSAEDITETGPELYLGNCVSYNNSPGASPPSYIRKYVLL